MRRTKSSKTPPKTPITRRQKVISPEVRAVFDMVVELTNISEVVKDDRGEYHDDYDERGVLRFSRSCAGVTLEAVRRVTEREDPEALPSSVSLIVHDDEDRSAASLVLLASDAHKIKFNVFDESIIAPFRSLIPVDLEA